MKFILIIYSLIVITTGLPGRNRIWGGQNATYGQFPYTVAFNNPRHYCAGVIIAPNWILTAAQCLNNLDESFSIYVGSHINNVNGTSYPITNSIIHDGFNNYTYQNDIALIKLDTDLVFSDTIQAIEFSEGVAGNTTCTVVGWGSMRDYVYPDNLQYMETTYIDMDLCQNITVGQLLEAYLGPEQVCALVPEGQGTCWGDAGGPLVCDGKLLGIVSYAAGYNCGTIMPDVYTSISAYLGWILALIQP